MAKYKYLGTAVTKISFMKKLKEQIKFRECLLPFFSEFFVFPFPL
jgi:hypothetical protein